MRHPRWTPRPRRSRLRKPSRDRAAVVDGVAGAAVAAAAVVRMDVTNRVLVKQATRQPIMKQAAERTTEHRRLSRRSPFSIWRTTVRPADRIVAGDVRGGEVDGRRAIRPRVAGSRLSLPMAKPVAVEKAEDLEVVPGEIAAREVRSGLKGSRPPEDEDVDVDELLADLPEGVLETEAVAEPAYDDSEDSDSEPVAQPDPVEVVSSQPAAGPQPRRRVAIVAHADRDSLLAAILLARDIRLVVGIWVYPQAELMTFFRGVVTDLKEETPIFMVGFTPSPAREVLQAVSLCSDRLTWFDHHNWPPEDLEAVKQAIGEDRVHLNPGAGSSLPGVLEGATRRSRFSDKLVDLATGRFTQHDYERWGRLWWSRLGEIAGKTGDRRADIDALLVGRPSDLAKEAERIAVPAAPDEIAYVSSRDFRLVHFAGYILVVVEVGDDLNPHLAARIARERYAAPLSLTRHHDSEVLVLAADEPAGRRSLDVGTVVGQLGDKVDWVEALADNDHLARFRIRDLAQHPDRLEEVIGMIAMARSFLER